MSEQAEVKDNPVEEVSLVGLDAPVADEGTPAPSAEQAQDEPAPEAPPEVAPEVAPAAELAAEPLPEPPPQPSLDDDPNRTVTINTPGYLAVAFTLAEPYSTVVEQMAADQGIKPSDVVRDMVLLTLRNYLGTGA